MSYCSPKSWSDLKSHLAALGSWKSLIDCRLEQPLRSATFLKALIGFLLAAGPTSTFAEVGGAPPLTKRPAAADYSAQIPALPLQFEKNAGQTDGQVEFLAHGPGYSLFLTSTQAVFRLAAAIEQKRGEHADSRAKDGILRMDLLDANLHPAVEGLEELPGKASYFIGDRPENWHVGIPTFARVKYREVYPGIDLIYYGNHRQLEYDFIVAPETDVKRIVLKIEGVDKLELNEQGDLVAEMNGTKVSWHRPIAFQQSQSGRKEIPVRFTLKKNRRIGFEVAAYDRTRPLIIDPVLVYATYLGGTGNEMTFNSFAPNGVGIAVDAGGNVFVVGQTLSRNFPTRNAYDSSPNGPDTNLCDVFITKFNANGNALIYSTYLGGISNDVAGGIAVDSAGNAYITGSTESPDFPHINAFQSVNNGFNDIFVTKLSSNGTSIVYSTFLGGSQDDFGRAIAVDSTGSAYITGKSWSKGTGNPPYPTSHGAYQADNGGGNTYSSDAIVAKFDATGAMVYSTFLGGKSDEEGNAIAVDSAGNACIAGQVLSTTDYPSIPDSDFPVVNAFQPNFNAGGTNLIFLFDGFVTKLNAAGSGLIFSTFLGGEEDDTATGITLDAKGRIYVTGSTSSSSFPSTANAAQPANAGAADDPLFPGSDAFVTVFETNGTSLVYSTYLGGTDFEEGDSIRLNRFGIAVDSFGDIYVAGQTSSFDFPLTKGADQTNSEAANDVFVAKINPAVPGPAGLVYSTLLSGSIGTEAGGALNEAEAIAVDGNGNFYVAGLTTAINFPVTAGAYSTTNKGGYEVFVAKFSSPRDLSVVMSPSAEPVVVGSNLTYTIRINNNGRSSFTGVTNIVQVPTNAAIISVASTAGIISTNAGQVVLNIGNMTNNASITETIVLATSVPGTMTSTSMVSSIETPTLEPNTDNNVSTVVSTVRGIADVRVTVASGAPNPVTVTSNLTYTFTVGNKGPWPATSVVLTDSLPAALTFVSAANSLGTCSYDPFSGIVSCNFGTMANGATATVTITANAIAGGPVANTATISAFELDLNPANNSGSVSTTVIPLTDLSISQTGPTNSFVGVNFAYTLRVTNFGPSAASSTVVTDLLPSGSSLVSALPSQGTYSQTNGVVTWNAGNIANNGTASLTLTLNSMVEGTFSNIATITNSAGSDTVGANNMASVSTTLNPAADLAISQIAAPGSTAVSSNVTFTIAVTNRGPSTAANVILSDAVPPSFSILSIQSPPNSSCFQSNGVLICNFGSLSNTATASLVIMVQARLDGTFNNMASVASSTADLNTNNNSSASVIVTPNPDAPLLKIVRNGTNAILSWSTNAVGYTLQSRTNFSSASFWISITNGLRQSGGLFFITNPMTAGTSFYRLSKAAADLMIHQIASPSSTEVTSNATFTITVSNSGPSTATNVLVTENLPAALSIVSIQSPPGTFCNQSNGVISCNFGNLANGTSADLILLVQATVDGTFTSTASATSATPDYNTNNSSSATLIVAPNPNAPLLKINRVGAKVVLSWSTNAVGYTLQSTTNFLSLWSPVSVQGQSGGQFFVTNSTTGLSFYRLIK